MYFEQYSTYKCIVESSTATERRRSRMRSVSLSTSPVFLTHINLRTCMSPFPSFPGFRNLPTSPSNSPKISRASSTNPCSDPIFLAGKIFEHCISFAASATLLMSALRDLTSLINCSTSRGASSSGFNLPRRPPRRSAAWTMAIELATRPMMERGSVICYRGRN